MRCDSSTLQFGTRACDKFYYVNGTHQDCRTHWSHFASGCDKNKILPKNKNNSVDMSRFTVLHSVRGWRIRVRDDQWLRETNRAGHITGPTAECTAVAVYAKWGKIFRRIGNRNHSPLYTYRTQSPTTYQFQSSKDATRCSRGKPAEATRLILLQHVPHPSLSLAPTKQSLH